MTCCSKLALNCAQGLAQCVDRKYSVRGHIKTFCWSARRQPWTNASRPTEAASQAVHVPATTGDGIWFQRTQRQVNDNPGGRAGRAGRDPQAGSFQRLLPWLWSRESVLKGGVEKSS